MRTSGKIIAQFGPHEKNEKRHDQSPGQHAAGELNRGKADADDVANAQIRRTHIGRRERARATGSKYVGIRRGAKPHLTSSQGSYLIVNVQIVCEQAESAQNVSQAANANIPE